MNIPNLKIALIIPTWNANRYLSALFASIQQQTLQPHEILVIDSDSTDGTKKALESYPIRIHSIPQSEFDHGGTRQLGVELIDADIYIFMTQDALPANPFTFQHLVQDLLSDSRIGCVYGRQLPAKEATPLSAHLRLFNYPSESHTQTYLDRTRLGIKTCFNSNSFAAYKKSALREIGGFPKRLILGEDIYVAAKMLLKNYHVRYAAHAQVHHSHNFTLHQEFKRYFAIGVFHAQENWLIEAFTSPTNEGFKYIVSEIKYLIRNKKLHWLPRACCSWLAKLLGYQLGKRRKPA